MGNLITLPNITLQALDLGDGNQKSNKQQSTFDGKNYLNTRLTPEDGPEKEVVIRLLPMDLETGNPFVLVHTHNVVVPKSMVGPGENNHKSFICLHKTHGIEEKFGNKCPFCELNSAFYNEATKTTDPSLKEEYTKLSLSYKDKQTVICRCIERGKEHEGVKFWKFNIRFDKTDAYNQILKLAATRQASAAKRGIVENILDIYTGRDLHVVFKADKTAAPTIFDDSYPSPLADDEETMKKWIYDEKKWYDVFTCKPYEYLKLIADGKHPWFDRDKELWVDKAEYESEHNGTKSTSNQEIENANRQIAEMAQRTAQQIQAQVQTIAQPAPQTYGAQQPQQYVQQPQQWQPNPGQQPGNFAASITLNDGGDMPF